MDGVFFQGPLFYVVLIKLVHIMMKAIQSSINW
jgi:hypothetical protein